MIKRKELLSLAASGLALMALLALCFWLTSLDFGDFRPESPAVTFVLWALSTCVVIGTIALGFLLFRYLVKLYIERRQNKPGSRLATKLLAAVLALSVVPIALHVIYSISLLNRNFDKWFSQPTVEVLKSAERFMELAEQESSASLQASATQTASSAALEALLRGDEAGTDLQRLRIGAQAEYIAVRLAGQTDGPQEDTAPDAEVPTWFRALGAAATAPQQAGVRDGWVFATASMPGRRATVILGRSIPEGALQEKAFMEGQVREWQQLEAARPVVWRTYVYILALITIFMLVVAVWLAQFASRQITRPIKALVRATGKLAGGHLDYRVNTPATDELAGLVASFNSMGQALESKTRQLEQSNRDLERANAELEERRSFINAILESINPGVVSLDEDGRLLKFNESFRRLAGSHPPASLNDIASLLDKPDRSVFRHMFSTARRTGSSSREFEVDRKGRTVHLAVTVSSLDTGDEHHGFVVVLEDTTEIVGAQRSEAWQEVARRLAHEIKNPLTPVALAAGRIDRLLDRMEQAAEGAERDAIRDRLGQSTKIIEREVLSLKSLVDSFSDLARFPTVHPEETDLNDLVQDAVNIFDGRLPGVSIKVRADSSIPAARVDPGPFKRVIVNLIDNAAEVVQDCWVKEIVVATRRQPEGRGIEVSVADSGPGIDPEHKQKLFLPYFSTKQRGTGLGLSIVRSIIRDHEGTIRVEDNYPTGSRFIIEVPVFETASPKIREAAA